jgi:hypothetical protein
MNKCGKIWRHAWIILACLALAAFFGFVVMVLWNELLPAIAGLPELSFWQAVGILILARVLFGGLGGMGWHHGHKNPLKERWQNMSDEERKAFVMGHYGFHRHHRRGTTGNDKPPADPEGREQE